MKTSEILIAGKAEISDPEAWSNEGWARVTLTGFGGRVYYENADEMFSLQKLLDADKVCAIAATARVCIRQGIWVPDLSEGHSCDCDHCDANGDELDAETALSDFKHEAVELLQEASEGLFGECVETVNDDKEQHTHADIMLVYDLAIANALAREEILARRGAS